MRTNRDIKCKNIILFQWDKNPLFQILPFHFYFVLLFTLDRKSKSSVRIVTCILFNESMNSFQLLKIPMIVELYSIQWHNSALENSKKKWRYYWFWLKITDATTMIPSNFYRTWLVCERTENLYLNSPTIVESEIVGKLNQLKRNASVS